MTLTVVPLSARRTHRQLGPERLGALAHPGQAEVARARLGDIKAGPVVADGDGEAPVAATSTVA